MSQTPQNKQNFWLIILGVLVLALIALGVANSQKGDKAAPAATDAAVTDTAATETEEAATEEEAPATAEETAAADAAAPAATEEGAEPAGPLVAVVNGEEIHRSDLDAFMQMLPPQMQGAPLKEVYPAVQKQLVTNEIIQQKADADSSVDSAEVEKRVADARQQIIRGLYVENKVNAEVTPAAVDKAYEDFKSKQEMPEEVHARHILVKNDQIAKEIIAKLEAGEDFAALAKQYSEDPGTKETGDLGYFTEDMMVPEFAKAAFGMQKGETSKEPVQTQFGWHVIRVEDRRQRPVPTLEEVRPMLEAELRRTAFTNLMNELERSAKVEYYDMDGKPGAEPAIPGAPQ